MEARWGHRIVFKRSDIGRDKVLMCIKRITAITLLKLGITEKYTSWLLLRAYLARE